MARIADLPIEVMASVLSELDNIKDLPAALLTCKHFYNAATGYSRVAPNILTHQITPNLLPYAVAALELSRLPRPHTTDSIKELLDLLYDEPEKLAARTQKMSRRDLAHLGHMHDIVRTMTNDFMYHAWALLNQDNLRLSPTECFRVGRAFYRLEILCNFCRYDSNAVEKGFEHRLFLNRQPPWKNEQMRSIHGFLCKKLVDSTFRLLSQDVEVGRWRVDYVRKGNGDYIKDKWLSQGLLFIHRLVNESSDDTKKTMLMSEICKPSGFAFRGLTKNQGSIFGDQSLHFHDNDVLKALVPRLDLHDTDCGPFKAWYAVNRPLRFHHRVSFMADSWQRNCGYVLWDWGRIEQYALLEILKGSETETISHDDVKAMRHSWEERRQIWDKGGRGYWVEGDTSKIVWPEQGSE